MKRRHLILIGLLLVMLLNTKHINASAFVACGVNNVEQAQIIDCSSKKNINYKALSNAKNVKRLVLKDNNLNEIPKEVYSMTNLDTLVLNKNNIKTIPNDIKRLTKLKTLIIDNNSFEKYPESINSLTNLTNLDISYNSIFCIPSSINNLTNLKKVYLNNNSINTIPEINKLTKLEYLNLKSNLLFELPNLNKTNIKNLYLDDNILSIKEVKTSVNNFTIRNQNTIKVISTNYIIEDLWFNKNNMIIANTEISNNKKLVGFKEYNIVNVKDNNGYNVRLEDYLDDKSTVKKSGKLKGDLELKNYNSKREVIKDGIFLELVFNSNGNNEEEDQDGSGNSRKRVDNYYSRIMLDAMKNNKLRNIETNDGNDTNDRLYQMMNDGIDSSYFDEYYSFFRITILSLLIFLMFVLPYIVITYLVRKIRGSMESLAEL